MNSSPTELYLPQNFPYPIKITALHAPKNSFLSRGTRLLEYSFLFTSSSDPEHPQTRFGTWDSPIDGQVHANNLHVADVISKQAATLRPAIIVNEPCKHDIQHGGMCASCGKDMTTTDYIGFSDAARANIQMTHSAYGPTVSIAYARELERETADHLLKSRKLSLIVDLDQTIVHATVDPTVGEWINEGQAWQARHPDNDTTNNNKNNNTGTNTPPKQQQDNNDKPTDGLNNDIAENKKNDDDGHPEQSTAEDEDECNPNWEALKDVKRFRLGPESFGPPALRDRASANAIGKGKNKMVETEGCMYYIKPRPGWKEFLRETASKYEMHVYTMGTRAYAEEVCAAIDPDGNIFGGRLLSRDESGSLTQKSLQRLFPTDTSMVVIIDDRADVWEWSPNLLKVIPYDFFIGIGDINSSFLPKIEPLAPSAVPGPGSGPGNAQIVNGGAPSAVPPSSQPVPPDKGVEAGMATSISDPSSSATTTDETVLFSQNNAALDAQLEERPLAKKERELQEHEHELEVAHQHNSSSPSPSPSPHPHSSPSSVHASAPSPVTPPTESTGAGDGAHTPSSEDGTSTPPASPKQGHKKALLKNDDYELDRIGKLLNEVHQRFFDAYDEHVDYQNRHSHHHKDKSKNKDQTRPRSKSKAGLLSKAFDVTRIIPRIRSEVFEGVHILFSSVIPLDTKPETTEIWRMAHMFGARCSTELTHGITHVVAAKRGTVKVDMARRRGGIKIVWLAWFTDSIALWQRQDEKLYLLDEPVVPLPPHPGTGTGTSTGPHAGSSGNMDDHDHGNETDGQHLTSSDLDVDLDDLDEWEQEEGGSVNGGGGGGDGAGAGGTGVGVAGPSGPAGLNVDWNDLNDEVEAFMNESDDEEEDPTGYYAGFGMGMGEYDEYDEDLDDASSSVGMRSGNVSEAEGEGSASESTNTKPTLKRKRLRSRTPSDYGGSGVNGFGSDDEHLGSPLAKRKKLAADRTGMSRLKEGITADEIGTSSGASASGVNGSGQEGEGGEDEDEDYEEEEDGDEEDEDEEEEDDFLARALKEEEWG